ncbi:alpha-l-rhamnosidase [Niveomyces insectorum RCEF 264]|uniref:alpha-L-rhamnosidase n=1 Tax=Niveomyces insectorum RCEF 264 TaxID=1081102 RepID=A0A167SLE0_9HYPO|nr:alpha-l-rhamnosidase [Niveomyces insectorum RCEF 264]
MASVHPTLLAPTVEQHATGFGVGVSSPRLSWLFAVQGEPPQDWAQTAYELEIVRSERENSKAATTEQYKIEGSASVLVPWPSTPLQSREQARVRVRAYGNTEAAGPTRWSPWTVVESGLLDRHDWSASLITSSTPFLSPDVSSGPLRPIRFSQTFVAPSADAIASRSRLYITSLGVYTAYLNGRQIGDHCMAPGWTSYAHRLNYHVFDVAPLLTPGETNVLAVEVAEGWYAGRLGIRGGLRYIYGKEIGLLAQLEIGGGPGSPEFTLVSDKSWSCSPSAILRSEIYDGEVYDAREEPEEDWTQYQGRDTDSSTRQTVRVLPFPDAEIVAPSAPPVRVVEEVNPVELITTPSGKTIVDFGQNLVGRLLVRSLHKPRGCKVVFFHAEVLENGELCRRPLRVAACVDTVISAGEEIRHWHPKYTFHGFRYVQIDEWSPNDTDHPLRLDSISAQVLHTDMVRTGHFSCSHPLVNKLHQNAIWSMRGNLLSIPTDCPQRDERLGWTGDLQVFCPSANFLYNTAGMLDDWLRDLAAEQLIDNSDGVPPLVVPDVLQPHGPRLPQAVWGDIAVLTPWALYRSYADKGILRQQYESMAAWVDRAIIRGPDRLWDPHLWQLGDWLDPTAPPDEPGNARTSGSLVADAYLVHVTSVLGDISRILGEEADAARYAREARQLKATFQAKYIAPSGLLVGDSQTALSLALVFDLHATAAQAARAAERLVDLVRFAKFRVATGFAGTPIITHALTKSGHHQVAYRMLLEKNRPSWMYPIGMGATTVWERWDSLLPDGSVNPGQMTSFNHYALGSVVNWLHECVAGVSPLDPGWKTFRVSPIPGGSITSADATYETPYGRLECRWSISDGDRFQLHVLVPSNSRALVVLPHERTDNGSGKWVGSGRHAFESRWDNLSNWPPTPLGNSLRTDGSESIA